MDRMGRLMLLVLVQESTLMDADAYRSTPRLRFDESDIKFCYQGGCHRFCEPGVKEPDLNNPKLWVWHYPYNSIEQNEILTDPTIIYLNSVQQANIDNMPWDQNSTLWMDYLDDFWFKVDENELNQTFGANVTKQANFWPDFFGHRARIAEQYIAEISFNVNPVTVLPVVPTSKSTPHPSSSPLPPPPAFAAGICYFHLIEW
ncbi:hypothetical protein BPAE_0546g00010 [Botrytis paeoniae]|uniref:Uncharacterized protein n=1 Tax=Botrytis paeoniae TaxID=278948 RepID=A0A4Z1EW45_9HELO|nr:hypothetical protein BPAE_0546g00010 [Botrytis paeoniae]